jgi:hypothetical protein
MENIPEAWLSYSHSIHEKLQFEGSQSKGQMPIAKLKYLLTNGDREFHALV